MKRLYLAVVAAMCVTGLEFLFRNRDVTFYLVGAPFYIDSVTAKSGFWVGYMTLIYNVVWALVFAWTWRRKYFWWLALILFLALHGLLTHLASTTLSKQFGEALGNVFKQLQK